MKSRTKSSQLLHKNIPPHTFRKSAALTPAFTRSQCLHPLCPCLQLQAYWTRLFRSSLGPVLPAFSYRRFLFPSLVPRVPGWKTENRPLARVDLSGAVAIKNSPVSGAWIADGTAPVSPQVSFISLAITLRVPLFAFLAFSNSCWEFSLQHLTKTSKKYGMENFQ